MKLGDFWSLSLSLLKSPEVVLEIPEEFAPGAGYVAIGARRNDLRESILTSRGYKTRDVLYRETTSPDIWTCDLQDGSPRALINRPLGR
ncbi:hypothetical protein PUN28_006215 [Cardiocondyla obscurior]|uniref:Uncharacterized protein n=1 Tax=Cardiocondyla obscurior TaxID=286306 RepID=A0AAW2G9D5_9HYME